MQLKWLVPSAGKNGYFVFCKLFSKFMSRCPFSGVELRGKAHLQKFDLSKIRVKFLKIREQRFRHICLLLSYLTFFSKKKHFWSSARVR